MINGFTGRRKYADAEMRGTLDGFFRNHNIPHTTKAAIYEPFRNLAKERIGIEEGSTARESLQTRFKQTLATSLGRLPEELRQSFMEEFANPLYREWFGENLQSKLTEKPKA